MAGNNMAEHDGTAKVEKIKRWSPVWIVPIVTALIGAWILFITTAIRARKSR